MFIQCGIAKKIQTFWNLFELYEECVLKDLINCCTDFQMNLALVQGRFSFIIREKGVESWGASTPPPSLKRYLLCMFLTQIYKATSLKLEITFLGRRDGGYFQHPQGYHKHQLSVDIEMRGRRSEPTKLVLIL